MSELRQKRMIQKWWQRHTRDASDHEARTHLEIAIDLRARDLLSALRQVVWVQRLSQSIETLRSRGGYAQGSAERRNLLSLNLREERLVRVQSCKEKQKSKNAL